MNTQVKNKNNKKNKPFNIKDFDVKKFRGIVNRGLSDGAGTLDGSMCIEAAICETMGLNKYTKEDLKENNLPEPKYRPTCVCDKIIDFKISLNDLSWSSEEARAEGLFDLGLAQLGSKGVVNGKVFIKTFKKDYLAAYSKSKIGIIKEQLTPNQVEIFDFLYNKYFEKDFYNFQHKLEDLKWDIEDRDTILDIIERIIIDFNGSVEDIFDFDGYNDDDLNLIAKVALNVLIKLKSPGVKLLKNQNLRKI